MKEQSRRLSRNTTRYKTETNNTKNKPQKNDHSTTKNSLKIYRRTDNTVVKLKRTNINLQSIT